MRGDAPRSGAQRPPFGNPPDSARFGVLVRDEGVRCGWGLGCHVRAVICRVAVGRGVGLGRWFGERRGKANRAPSRLAGALSLWIGFGLSLRGTRLSRPVFDPLGRCRRPACGRWIRGRVLCLRGAAPRMRLGSGLPVGWVTRPRASDPGVCSGSARQPAGEPYLRRSVDIAHQAPLRHRQKTLSIKPASETDCPAPGEPRPGLGPHSGQLPALEPAPAPRSMRSAGPSRGW